MNVRDADKDMRYAKFRVALEYIARNSCLPKLVDGERLDLDKLPGMI